MSRGQENTQKQAPIRLTKRIFRRTFILLGKRNILCSNENAMYSKDSKVSKFTEIFYQVNSTWCFFNCLPTQYGRCAFLTPMFNQPCELTNTVIIGLIDQSRNRLLVFRIYHLKCNARLQITCKTYHALDNKYTQIV